MEERSIKAARYEPLKEIRFAVVIYGGVSLAIYINGIVQEMLRLVRATAPARSADPGEPLLQAPVGSERVYRKLGQLLGNPHQSLGRLWEAIQKGEPLPIRARFVIDVLSGTSAGGINAIFLGKALANNQDLQNLQELWIDKGDIELLINDKKSLTRGLFKQNPPQSLLNSQRMYLELLDALDGMDRVEAAPASPLLDHLDLFSTATDIAGLVMPIQLADSLIYERRHRNVFHFQYPEQGSQSGNPFTSANNPFLAFAARCTSAFPFAFEPMTLGDIFSVLGRSRIHAGKEYSNPDTEYWQRYYLDYAGSRNAAARTGDFHARAFGDGGYLDNKPFSYAIDAMLAREADVPLERKLIYIEPSPQDELAAQPASARPNAIENSLAALLSLPRYESIRQDLERVVDRNSQIDRINRVIRDVQRSIEAPRSGKDPHDWLAEGSEAYGPGYLMYERLKLSGVTDDWADLLAQSYSIDTRSAYGKAIRVLAGVWRDLEYSNEAGPRLFLLQFDIQYRLRRIRYVWRVVNDRYEAAGASGESADAYRAELYRIKRKLAQPYASLRALTLAVDLKQLELPPELFSQSELELVIDPAGNLDALSDLEPYRHARERSERGLRERAAYVLQVLKRKQGLTSLAMQLSAAFEKVTKGASADIERILDEDPGLTLGARRARKDARAAYDGFERYDSAAFPILFGTDLGESEQIDIHRISPEDATARQRDVLGSREKVKGTKLAAFGAFLDRDWRRNDILWGRLDGAERLISILLPGSDAASVEIRAQLIDEAHEAIVREFLEKPDANWKAALREFVAAVPKDPEPQLVARSAARATAVTGALLEDIADQRDAPGKALFRRMAFAGRMLWHLVEVAVPRSWHEVLVTYWMQLFLLFAVLLLGAAAVFQAEAAVWKLAMAALGIAVGAIFARTVMRRYISGRAFLTPAPAGLMVIALLGIAGLAFLIDAANTHTGWAEQAQLQWRAWQPALAAERWLPALSVAAALGTLIAAWLVFRAGRRAREQSGGRPRIGLRLQFASSWADVRRALGAHDARAVTAVSKAVRLDYALAAAYGVLSLSLGLWLASTGPRVGALAGLFGVAAAAMDVCENNAVLALLERAPPPDISEPLPRRPAPFARAKWILLALACACAVGDVCVAALR